MPDAERVTAIRHPGVMIATAGGLGFLRPAPGTWASVAAGAIGWAVRSVVPVDWLIPALLGMVALALAAGLWSCRSAITFFARRDPSQVVIDEVAGVWLALALIPAATLTRDAFLAVAMAVGWFRVFDIAKPWPVVWLERLPGAWGIMADDLAAGLLAGALTAAILH